MQFSVFPIFMVRDENLNFLITRKAHKVQNLGSVTCAHVLPFASDILYRLSHATHHDRPPYATHDAMRSIFFRYAKPKSTFISDYAYIDDSGSTSTAAR
jgi:hypothetical protein